MKYIVMECHPGYAVLMDEEGRFVKAANFSYEVGQTVESPMLMQTPIEKRRKPRGNAVTGGLLAACLMVVCIGFYTQFVQAYAEVYISVNPSVRMNLNRRGDVLSMEGMNRDGRMLLEDYKLESRDRLEVAESLIERVIDRGYMKPGSRVIVEVYTPSAELTEQYEAEFAACMGEYVTERVEESKVEIVESDGKRPEEWHGASGQPPFWDDDDDEDDDEDDDDDDDDPDDDDDDDKNDEDEDAQN